MRNYLFNTSASLMVSLLCALPTQLMAEDRALIIAIGNYENPKLNLQGPAQDVAMMQELVSDYLEFKPSQIKVLHDSAATKKGIEKAIKSWLIRGTREGDRVFLSYSGHGAQQPDQNGDEEDGQDETLVPYDTKKVAGKIINMITDDQMEGWLAQLKGRNVSMVVDSCHSGTITRSASLFGEDDAKRTFFWQPQTVVQEVLTRGIEAHKEEEPLVKAESHVTTWTAASSYQVALDDVEKRPRSGMFTNRFYSAIKNKKADLNRDGTITHSEMLDHLRNESNAFCKRQPNLCPKNLTPTLETKPEWLSQSIDVSLLGRKLQVLPVASVASESLASTSTFQDQQSLRLDIVDRAGNANRRTFKKDETIGIRVNSSVDGYLTLIQIDADQTLTQLYPNQYSYVNSKTNVIKKGEQIVFPNPERDRFELPVAAPFGEHHLFALVTKEPVDLSKILDSNSTLDPVKNPKLYLAQIGKKLRETWSGDENNRAAEWLSAHVIYNAKR